MCVLSPSAVLTVSFTSKSCRKGNLSFLATPAAGQAFFLSQGIKSPPGKEHIYLTQPQLWIDSSSEVSPTSEIVAFYEWVRSSRDISPSLGFPHTSTGLLHQWARIFRFLICLSGNSLSCAIKMSDCISLSRAGSVLTWERKNKGAFGEEGKSYVIFKRHFE